jgi:hypothetical protein
VERTPEQEAAYALDNKLSRDGLSPAAQAEYDRQLADRIEVAKGAGRCATCGGVHSLDTWPIGHQRDPAAAPVLPTAMSRIIPPRSSPAVRARILQLIKQANPKYAKPFEKDRIAAFSLMGTESWAEYGQVVLQMAILDTLLSIEDLLTQASGSDGSDEDR